MVTHSVCLEVAPICRAEAKDRQLKLARRRKTAKAPLGIASPKNRTANANSHTHCPSGLLTTTHITMKMTRENPNVKTLYRNCLTLATTLATVATLMLAPTAPTLAQTDGQKPALVVSIASTDTLLGDINYLTKAAGAPELGGFINLMAGQYIGGLDTTKPSGIYINIVGNAPVGVAFVAVSDFDQVVTKIEDSVGELEDVGGGVRKLSLQRDIFIKSQGGWAFISDSTANLKGLPEDPTKMLGGLNEQYNIGIRVGMQSIPQELRQMALSEIKKGFEQAMASQAAGEDEQELQENLGRQSIESLERFMAEADEVTVGWGVDQADGKTYLDFSVTALDGSKLAKQVATSTSAKSDFSGFLLPNAAATLHVTSLVTGQDKTQALEMLKVLRTSAAEEIDKDDDIPNEQVRKLAKEFVESMVDILAATLETGRVNGGAAVLLDSDAVQFVAGGYVADGRAVEAELKKLVKLAKEADAGAELDNITFNAAKHNDVDLHTFTVPIPEDERDARRVLGDRLNVVVGTGKTAAYVAFGKDCTELLKKVIDDSAAAETSGPPIALTVSLGNILQFASTFQTEPIVAAMASALQEADGKDKISITGEAIDRGIRYRVEVGEAVLSLIGKVAQMQSGANEF